MNRWIDDTNSVLNKAFERINNLESDQQEIIEQKSEVENQFRELQKQNLEMS